MNYNNPYFNPYNQYPYSQPQQPQQQVNYVPLVYVSGIQSVETYIVNPSTTVLLKDTQNNVIYEKSADAQGIYSTKIYKLNDNSKTSQEKVDLSVLKDKVDKLYQEFEKRFPKEEISHE